MSIPFRKDFILPDGTEVQVKESSEGCYQFMLFSPQGLEDAFTWDAEEARDVQGNYKLSDQDRRRNEALKELWKVI